MQEMEDKKFDELFRQSAAQRNIPFDTKAWQLMQNKLKAKQKRKAIFYWLMSGLGLGIVLWIGLIYTDFSLMSPNISIENKSPKDKKIETKNRYKQDKNQEIIKLNQNTKDIQKNTDKVSRYKEVTTNKFAEKNQILYHQESNNISDNLIDSNQRDTAKATLIDNSKHNDFRIFATDSLKKIASMDVLEEKRQLINIEKIQSQSFEVIIKDSSKPRQEEFEKVATPYQKRLSPWAISLSISPDMSSVNLLNVKQLGTNVGLSIEYHFASRFSLNMGALYSVKTYRANPDDYEPSPGYWQQFNKPDRIDAGCDVLDIPVNLRYYLGSQANKRLFLSAGVSSYWMLKERYNYIYDNPYYPYIYLKEVNNENKHFLSVANLSLGFQKTFHTNWNMQIEPFVKLPLAGVGYGKIKLISSGVLLSLKYRFNKHTK